MAAQHEVGDTARTRPCVLVVDDNELNRKLLGAILNRAGYDFCEAVDGAHAVAVAAAQRPDLILLDIMMPVMDGFQACLALKQDERTALIPVIFLTALSETADRDKGLHLGAVDYLVKPFDRSEVLARVRNHLGQATRG